MAVNCHAQLMHAGPAQPLEGASSPLGRATLEQGQALRSSLLAVEKHTGLYGTCSHWCLATDREAKKQGTGGEGESPHSLCTRTEANLDSRAVGRKARGPRETLIVVNTISGDSTGLPRKLRDGTYGSWLGKGLVWPNTIQYVVKTK